MQKTNEAGNSILRFYGEAPNDKTKMQRKRQNIQHMNKNADVGQIQVLT